MSRYLHPASTFLRQCFLASSRNTKFISLRTQASQWRNHSEAGNGLKFPPRCDYQMQHHSRRHSSNSRAAAISDDDKIREANNEKTPSMIQEAEVTKERSAVISSPLILKQRKEDLTELERDLKQALKRYKSLVDVDSNASIADQQRRQSLEAVRIAYEKLSYWDEALATEQAIEEAFVVSQLDQAASLYRQGKLHMRMGAQMEALRHYEKSLALFKQEHVKNAGTSYHADMGNVLISIAGVDFARDRLESSLSILQDSEVHFRYHEQQSLNVDLTKLPSPPHLDLVKCLSHQGLLYRSMGDFSTALSKYREGLQTLEEIIDSSSFADPKAPNGDDSTDNTAVFLEKREGLHMDIADMLLAMENYDEALEIFQSILDGERKRNRTSLEVIESNSSDCDLGTPLEGVMLHNIGKIHGHQGHYEQAIKELSRSVQIKSNFVGESHPEVAKTLTVLGAIHATLQNKAEALECFQQALLIARMHSSDSTGQDPEVMFAMRNIAVLKGENVPKWGSSFEDED